MNIISEWKRTPKVVSDDKRNKPVKRGFKRVMAVVDGRTQHIDIAK